MMWLKMTDSYCPAPGLRRGQVPSGRGSGALTEIGHPDLRIPGTFKLGPHVRKQITQQMVVAF